MLHVDCFTIGNSVFPILHLTFTSFYGIIHHSLKTTKEIIMKVFNGGIQKGTVATDEYARRLDNQCKDNIEAILSDIKADYGNDITVQKKLRKDQIPGNIGSCSPDGGAWFYKGILIAVFEAKKQNDSGNAIERWFKNNRICRIINDKVSYVTFSSGSGATIKGVIGRTLNIEHLDGFNTYIGGGNTCYLSIDGYTNEEIYQYMYNTIAERIEAYK